MPLDKKRHKKRFLAFILVDLFRWRVTVDFVKVGHLLYNPKFSLYFLFAIGLISINNLFDFC